MGATSLGMPDMALQGGARFLAVSSANGMRTVDRAMELMKAGTDTLDAAIAGVNIVELDPNDMSVGYGGLPNEDGIVELDSSCMHGPTYRGGAVASLRGIKTPSNIAQLVLQRTDHCLLVAEGALRGQLAYTIHLGPHHALAAAFRPQAIALARTDRRILRA